MPGAVGSCCGAGTQGEGVANLHPVMTIGKDGINLSEEGVEKESWVLLVEVGLKQMQGGMVRHGLMQRVANKPAREHVKANVFFRPPQRQVIPITEEKEAQQFRHRMGDWATGAASVPVIVGTGLFQGGEI